MLIALGVLVLAVLSLCFTVVYLAALVNRTIVRYTAMIQRMAERSEDERERIIQRKQFPERAPAQSPRVARVLTAEEKIAQARRRAALSSVGTVKLEEGPDSA